MLATLARVGNVMVMIKFFLMYSSYPSGWPTEVVEFEYLKSLPLRYFLVI